MSSKSKATISLDPHIWEQFKNEAGKNKASSTIEDLIKTWLNTAGNKPVELEERKQELEEEKKDLKQQLEKINERISNIDGELESIEAAIEEHEKNKSRVAKAVDDLSDEINSVRKDKVEKKVKSLSTTQRYHHWLSQLDIDSQELQDRIISEVKA